MSRMIKISKRKQEILNAAAILFRYKGYSATSMRDLAEKVGLEVSSLYSHIKSKEEILITLCFNCANLYSQGLNQIMDMDTSAMQKFDAIMDLHINIAIDHPSSITVFNDEWKHLGVADLTEFLKVRKNYEKVVKSVLQNGIDEKVFKEYPLDILMNTVLSAMRWIHYSNTEYSKVERSTVQSTVKNIVMSGIKY
jgi:TetR/AcrR family transcriptional regulator, cholesterol catabolism regulator